MEGAKVSAHHRHEALRISPPRGNLARVLERLTMDQVVAMAPDAAGLKSGRELASPRRWRELGADDELVWGLALGSGAEPYQVQALPRERAYKCSCPSRKLPCKHVLGLLLLAADPAALPRAERPPWAGEWLAQRAANEQRRQERAGRRDDGAGVDLAAQAKRRDARAQKTSAGLALLEQWLADVVRVGLADPGARSRQAWVDMERRLVDAQAPGIADRLRSAGELLLGRPGNELAVFEDLGRLHLLARAFERRAELDEPLVRNLCANLGWPVTAEEASLGVGVHDLWVVVGRERFERASVATTLCWFVGATCGSFAYLLYTDAPNRRDADAPALGLALRGELVFHPGAAPLRGMFRATPTVEAAPNLPSASLANVLLAHAQALAAEPWRRATPFLAQLRLGMLDTTPFVVDEHGDALEWAASPGALELFEALGAGGALLSFGLWDGRAARLLAVFDGPDCVALTESTP
jgi:hypothetical protein